MFEKYTNPNKKGIAKAVDAVNYAGVIAVSKLLSPDMGKAVHPTTPDEYQHHADTTAQKLMTQTGMVDTHHAIIPPSAEVAALSTNGYYEPSGNNYGVPRSVLQAEEQAVQAQNHQDPEQGRK